MGGGDTPTLARVHDNQNGRMQNVQIVQINPYIFTNNNTASRIFVFAHIKNDKNGFAVLYYVSLNVEVI